MDDNFKQEPGSEEIIETQNPAPRYSNQQPDSPSMGMSIAALVCGILGIIGSFIPGVCYFTLVLAILGIVFGAKGMKQAKETGQGKGLAVAGLVLGIVGTAFSVIAVICIIACAASLGGLGALSELSSSGYFYSSGY